MLRNEINSALKDAMKARDERRVSTLRLINAAVTNADIEAQLHGRESLGDDQILAVLQKMLKQRQESVEIYNKAGRKDLAEQEQAEIGIISAYLPKQMSDIELKAVVTTVIGQIEARNIKDMGKVMAVIKQDHAGRVDLGKASALVKGMLSG